MLSNSYGAVITHIESENLAMVPISDAPKEIKEKINKLVNMSYELRDQLNKMIDEATSLFVKELELLDVTAFYEKEQGIVNAFSIRLSEINLRLYASYHIPEVDKFVNHMKKYADEVITIGDARISNKLVLAGVFKRTYVGEEYGYPFL